MTVLGAFVAAAPPLVFWWLPDWARTWAGEEAGLPQASLHLSDAALSHAGLVALLPSALGLFALWQLWQLFGAFADGDALTTRAQDHLRRFAWTLIAMALAHPLYRAALSVVFTLENPPGQRMLSIGLGSDDYVRLLLGAVLLAIAVVMGEAVRATEENRSFV